LLSHRRNDQLAGHPEVGASAPARLMKKSGGFAPSLKSTAVPPMPLDREYIPAVASVHPQLKPCPPRLHAGARMAGAPWPGRNS
jgi:hypothetical protein